MKIKFTTTEQFKKIIELDEKIVFSDTSPVSGVTTPPNTVFVARHGVIPTYETRNSVCGTMYVFRTDSNDSVVFNVDVYNFLEDNDSSKIRIKEVPDSSLDYHWTNNLPGFIMNDAPRNIIERVQSVKGMRKIDI